MDLFEPSPHAIRMQPLPEQSELRREISAPHSTVRAASCSKRAGANLAQLRLVADADEDLDTASLKREFPTVSVIRAESTEPGDLVIDDFAWRGAFDFRRFDELVQQSRPVTITVRGGDAAGVAMEVMGRYQRFILRRNEASSTPLFDDLLDAHAALFDASRSEDCAHALDTWQWMLRLEPQVGLVPQLAALLHEVDRLDSERWERLEHRAYRAQGDMNTDDGNARVRALLRTLDVSEDVATAVCDLVSGRTTATEGAAVLDDADALSFLSLMTPRYADYFGLAQTRRKVAFMLRRLGDSARGMISLLRLRPDIDRLLGSCGPEHQ